MSAWKNVHLPDGRARVKDLGKGSLDAVKKAIELCRVNSKGVKRCLSPRQDF